MKTKEMIAWCVLGVPDLIDEICDNFDCTDFTSEYLAQVISDCSPSHLSNVGNVIIRDLYEKIIEYACKEHHLDKEKFDYYIDRGSSELTYNGNKITKDSDIKNYENKTKEKYGRY